MNKKILTIILIIILSISNVNANPFATIAMTGLKFLNPEVTNVVNGVICVSNPLTCAQGKVIGQVYGEALQAVAEASPEAANAIVSYNQIKSYVDNGASIVKELEINEEGEIEKGELEFKEQAGGYFGKQFGFEEDSDVYVKDVAVEFNEDENYNMVTFKEEGVFQIQQETESSIFTNIKQEDETTNAYIKLDREGNIIGADFTTTDEQEYHIYILGNNQITVPPNSQVIFDGEKVIINSADNSEIAEFPTVLDENLENKIVEFRGKNVKLPNDLILQDGVLNYHNGQFYVNKENFVTIEGINIQPIDNKVDINFNSMPCLGDCVSFSKNGERSFFMVDENPYKVTFLPGNPIFDVEENDNLKLHMNYDAKIFVGHHDKEHIPFITYETNKKDPGNWKEDVSHFDLENGFHRYNFFGRGGGGLGGSGGISSKDGEFEDMLKVMYKRVELEEGGGGSVPLAITHHGYDLVEESWIFSNTNKMITFDENKNLNLFQKSETNEFGMILTPEKIEKLDQDFFSLIKDENTEIISGINTEDFVSPKEMHEIKTHRQVEQMLKTKKKMGDFFEETKEELIGKNLEINNRRLNMWGKDILSKHPSFKDGTFPEIYESEGITWKLVKITQSIDLEQDDFNNEEFDIMGRNSISDFTVFTLTGESIPYEIQRTMDKGHNLWMVQALTTNYNSEEKISTSSSTSINGMERYARYSLMAGYIPEGLYNQYQDIIQDESNELASNP